MLRYKFDPKKRRNMTIKATACEGLTLAKLVAEHNSKDSEKSEGEKPESPMTSPRPEIKGPNMNQPKRRKKRPMHGLKTVEVTRGKTGYGFTISGQHPCVLSCIVNGSPAEAAGLKPGDYLMVVNSENISKACHDDVIRLIGSSTGTITLQVAENYNSSDSSDDDYHHRTKSRFQNKMRTKPNGNGHHSDKVLKDSNHRESASSFGARPKDFHGYPKHMQTRRNVHSAGNLRSRLPGPVGAESAPQVVSKETLIGSGTKTTIGITKETTIGADSNVPPVTIEKRDNVEVMVPDKFAPGVFAHAASPRFKSPIKFSSSSAFKKPESDANYRGVQPGPILRASNNQDGPVPMEEEDDMIYPVNTDIRVVVGYVGSIEIPNEVNFPNARQQSIKNSVRRLNVEQNVHTLVLMKVTRNGVQLTNRFGATIANYAAEKVAFCGIYPEDKRFFGIVTLHTNESNRENGRRKGSIDECGSGSSCHVFMVDPELRSHNVHAKKAKSFHIQCTINKDTHRCLEFPRTAHPILRCVALLYRNRQNGMCDSELARLQVFSDPSRPPQRSQSNSSNSDSGLGFGRDDNHMNDRVCVVDLPRPPDPDNSWLSDRHPSLNDIQHLSPDVQTMPTPRHELRQQWLNKADSRGRLNISTSSEETSYQQPSERLTVRAMAANLSRGPSSDGLDKQHSAENLRISMHKFLQARQRHISDQVGSDQDSQASSKSDVGANWVLQTSIGNKRPMSAPFQQLSSSTPDVTDSVEMVDASENGLHPNRRPHSSGVHAYRCPSAPPINFHDHNSVEDQDIQDVIARFHRDKALGLGEDPRRLSDGFTLLKKSEQDSTGVDELQRWTKTGSFRRQKGTKIGPPLSQSHESLLAVDPECANGKISGAVSVNSIVSGVHEGSPEEAGRVASWAVSFEKLLADQAGLAVFTEFLRKEFSEENIIFWKTCEKFKNVTDPEVRQSRASEIFSTHLAQRASEPVNIDSNARHQTEKFLEKPTRDMFNVAQQQIFQLMKQDSYARFLKSDLYRGYLIKEISGQAVTFPRDESPDHDKSRDDGKKKISKANDDKQQRRRSLLPWKQKNNKHNLKAASDSDLKKIGKGSPKNKEEPAVKRSESSGPSPLTKSESEGDTPDNEENLKFCRVILPDGSTTVVYAKQGQTIRNVLSTLCEKRNMSVAAIDVFLLGSDRPQDLNDDISTLGSKEVMIERRVLFRLDLPNRKSIGVKAKPNRSIRDVFKPILNKYGYKIDTVGVQLSGQMTLLDVETTVSHIDNQRVIIIPKEDCAEWGSYEGRRVTTSRPPVPAKTRESHAGGTNLDVLTNQVFLDLMHGKSQSAHNFDELGILDPEKAEKSAQRNPDEHRLSGIFGLLRRESVGAKEAVKPAATVRAKGKVTFALQKTAPRRRLNDPDNEKFFELLTRAQSYRLDDQRGLTMRNPELPEFLRRSNVEKAKTVKRSISADIYMECRSQSPSMHHRFSSSETDDMDYIQEEHEKFEAYMRDSHPQSCRDNQQESNRMHSFGADARSISSFKTFGASTEKLASFDQSFSQEGVLPSITDAESYFHCQRPPTSPNFDDSRLMERSLYDIGLNSSMVSAHSIDSRTWNLTQSERQRLFHQQNTAASIKPTKIGIPKASPDNFCLSDSSKNESGPEESTMIEACEVDNDNLNLCPSPPPPPPTINGNSIQNFPEANFTPPPPLPQATKLSPRKYASKENTPRLKKTTDYKMSTLAKSQKQPSSLVLSGERVTDNVVTPPGNIDRHGMYINEKAVLTKQKTFDTGKHRVGQTKSVKDDNDNNQMITFV